VPLFAKRVESNGVEPAKRFAEETLALLLAGLFALLLAAELAMPWVMRLLAPGFADDPAKFDLAVLFARITFPYLLLISLTALFGAILNSFHRFAAAAAAPIALNVVAIAALAGLVPLIGRAGLVLSWAVLVSGILQFVWLALACQRAGLGLHLPRPRLTPSVRRLLKLMVPGAAAAGVTQINLLIGNIIASLQDGAVSWLYYADRLYQLPLGVIGVAVGVVLLPELSRRLRAGHGAGVQEAQNRAVELAMLLTLPAAVALMAVPQPIVAVLFERGAFDAADSRATAAALAAFALGLPAYVLIKVFSPAFFAREEMVAPLRYASAGVAVNIGLSLALFFVIGHVGIALATAAAAWLNAGLLGWRLCRRGHFVPDARLRRRLPRIGLACALFGAGLWGGSVALEPLFASPFRIAALGGLILAGMGGFLALVQITGAAPLAELRASFRRGS
jgi:putative peptidoglycan lipid II flippase